MKEQPTLGRSKRFANYLKLRDEVAAAADKAAHRRTQKTEEKVAGKALNKQLEDIWAALSRHDASRVASWLACLPVRKR